MAKQIIILERLNEPSDMTFRYAMWATVPAARQSAYANATATSGYSGVTAAELLAIQTGQVTERTAIWQATAGVPISAIQAALIAEFAVFQAEINARNPTRRFGTFWDGTIWVLGGTA